MKLTAGPKKAGQLLLQLAEQLITISSLVFQFHFFFLLLLSSGALAKEDRDSN